MPERLGITFAPSALENEILQSFSVFSLFHSENIIDSTSIALKVVMVNLFWGKMSKNKEKAYLVRNEKSKKGEEK